MSPFCYTAFGYRRVARYHESAIGRFTNVDPHAEKYYSISPYVYVANNPVKYIDPDKMVYRPTKDEKDHYTGFEWVDDSETYDAERNIKNGYFEKAILFKSKGMWTIGTKSGSKLL